ncbi:DUF4365 domain-containing protein [Streptomyces cinereoruber]|uniref:DUF4365 domain-containing protein n=1 Tax=Streptomyces cinereoruber TaxID=67260 RepID=UPI003C2F15F8
MRASTQEQTGSAGVSRVMADFTDLAWGPVENSRHDLGIDLFLQVRDERRFDRTVLVTAQVKAGASYFSEPVTDDQGNCTGWWYAESDARHFGDWIQHALPHLLVLHDETTRTSYWAHVTREAVVSTGDGFKIQVPVHQKVEPACRDALTEVAVSGKQPPVLQGTSFAAGAKAVAPGRELRHALVTPRLIAPHRNTSYGRTLAPEEAIALITQGRERDLRWYARKGANPRMVEAGPSARGWEWRFFSAYRQAVSTEDLQPLLDLSAATRPTQKTTRKRKKKGAQTHRIAACAVAAAVFLTAVERLEEAEAILLAIGDDLPPIDHAWVLIHRAIVLSEQGHLDEARRLAAAAQQSVALDPDDVTAAAIGASAADFIFRTSGPAAKDLAATMTAVDTAASWWRSQSVAWALTEHEERAFSAWGQCADTDTQASDTAQDRLVSAWLTASFAGARGVAAAALAQHAHHEVMHHEVTWRSEVATGLSSQHNQSPHSLAVSTARSLEDALDELRRFGCNKTLEISARRLWAAGPAGPVRGAAERSVRAPWTHANARAKLMLLERAGDLLPAELADEAARHCLLLLEDPAPFAKQVWPSFVIAHYVHRALWRVLSAAGDSVHAETAELLLRMVSKQQKQSVEEDLAKLAAHLRPTVMTASADRIRSAVLDHGSKSLSATLLGLLVSCGDHAAETELLRRAEEGDIEAIGEIPSLAGITLPTAQTLINMSTTRCREQAEEAHRGHWGLGGWDWARLLALCNFHFPEHAEWEPVTDLILDPQVAQEHKEGAVRALTQRADQIPDAVVVRLRDGFAYGRPTVTGTPGLMDEAGDLTEAAFALGLAIGTVDSATALQHILTWLRGSASQRQAAARLVAGLSRQAQNPTVQGALVIMTGDPQYQVRAAAASSLTRGLQAEAPESAVDAAISTAARESGCRVPLAVARALHNAPQAWETRQTLQTELQGHMSALVRAAASPQD